MLPAGTRHTGASSELKEPRNSHPLLSTGGTLSVLATHGAAAYPRGLGMRGELYCETQSAGCSSGRGSEALSSANWQSVIPDFLLTLSVGLDGMLPHMPAYVLTPSNLPLFHFTFLLFISVLISSNYSHALQVVVAVSVCVGFLSSLFH